MFSADLRLPDSVFTDLRRDRLRANRTHIVMLSVLLLGHGAHPLLKGLILFGVLGHNILLFYCLRNLGRKAGPKINFYFSLCVNGEK